MYFDLDGRLKTLKVLCCFFSLFDDAFDGEDMLLAFIHLRVPPVFFWVLVPLFFRFQVKIYAAYGFSFPSPSSTKRGGGGTLKKGFFFLKVKKGR